MNKARHRAADEDIETYTCSEESYNIANAKLEQIWIFVKMESLKKDGRA